MTKSWLSIALAAGSAAGILMAAPGVADAAPKAAGPKVHTLDTTVLAPYQLAIGRKGLYVADGGRSTVSRLTYDGLKTVATGTPAEQGGEVTGVALNRHGDLAYLANQFRAQGDAISTQLIVKHRGGGTTTADLLAYEQRKNPDGDVSYGLVNPGKCTGTVPGDATTKGGIDSHPYAVASLGRRGWLVADAAGNDLLRVSRYGKISTVAVLPAQTSVLSTEMATALQLPNCVGAKYRFEPVPTDVEVRHGQAYVSLLPGGPEDPSFGARGSVYRVGLRSGRAHRIAGGLAGATNLALAPHGKIYVTELFAGRISVIRNGTVTPYVDLPNVLSVVYGKGVLFAGTIAPTDDSGNPTGTGSLVAIR